MANPTTYERCKGIAHQWDDIPTPPDARQPPRGWADMHFRCVECTSVKRMRIHTGTGALRTSYWHPEDYGEVRDTKAEWRKAYYQTRKVRIQLL